MRSSPVGCGCAIWRAKPESIPFTWRESFATLSSAVPENTSSSYSFVEPASYCGARSGPWPLSRPNAVSPIRAISRASSGG